MSMNLILTDRNNRRNEFSLYQTPTEFTYRVLNLGDNRERLQSYKEWVKSGCDHRRAKWWCPQSLRVVTGSCDCEDHLKMLDEWMGEVNHLVEWDMI
jgi:hypothetical protein